jgi:hypothetical protein
MARKMLLLTKPARVPQTMLFRAKIILFLLKIIRVSMVLIPISIEKQLT